MTPLLQRYLKEVIKTSQSIDARGVMQVQRWIELNLDEIYVSLTVHLGREPAGPLRPRSSLRAPIYRLLLGTGEVIKFTEAHESGDAERARFLEQERLFEPREETGISLDELWRRDRNWVLLGDPGSGKTTVLKHLALKSAQAFLAGNAAQLPIPVTLRFFAHAWDQHPEWPPEQAILAYLEDSGLSELGFGQPDDRSALLKEFWSVLQNRQALLLLDGLDEQRDAVMKEKTRRDVEALLSGFPGNHCLVSSRIIGYDAAPLGLEFQVATLEPFGEEQMAQFFRNWLYAVEKGEDIVVDEATRKRAERKAYELIEQVRNNPGVKQLATNPLLCTIIGLIHRQGGTLPQQRAELYKLCVDTFIFNWEMHKRRAGLTQDNLNKDETQAVLEEIALHFQERCDENRAARTQLARLVSQFLVREQGITDADAQRRAEHLLALIREVAGLLIDRGEEEYGFFHLTFQEYLAARAVTRKRRDIDRYLNAHLFDPRWREVILLAAAHQGLKDEESGSEFIEAILRHRHQHEEEMQYAFRIAFQCLREARVEFETSDRLFGQWIDLYLNRHHLQGLLQKLIERSGLKLRYQPTTLQPLLQALKDEERIVRKAAASALGDLKDPASVPPLLDTLKDEEWEVRWVATEALGKIQDPASIQPLLQALKDEESIVRWTAVEALARFHEPASVPHLVQALKDEDDEVRWAAVGALSEFDDSLTLPHLLGCLHGHDTRSREAAATVLVLAESNHPQAIPALLEALRDVAPEVRREAAEALGFFEKHLILPDLNKLLRDQLPLTRRAAVRVLGKFNDPTVLPSLRVALSDKDFRVREAAVEALGGIEDSSVLFPLLDALRDEEAFVRWAAASELGSFKDPAAILALRQALEDKVPRVRLAASKALWTIKDPASLPTLFQLLQEEDPEIRQSVARTLATFKDPLALSPLLKTLNDSDPKVREESARALGNLRDVTALPHLLVTLKDENDDVRLAGVWALRDMKNPASVPSLLQALEDEDWRVRRVAALSLGSIKDPSALPTLLQALKDEDLDLCQAAAEAIELIELGAAL